MTADPDRLSPPLDLISESVADRLERVDRISQRLAAGSYEVAATDVADAVVAFFARSLEVARPRRVVAPGDPDDPSANPGNPPHSC